MTRKDRDREKFVYRLTLAAFAAILLPIAPAEAQQGYLAPAELPPLALWLPPPPATGSVQEAADLDEYLAARPLLAGARGAEAIADNVYDPVEVVTRFDGALGFPLDRRSAPRLIALMDRVMRDEEAMLQPVKRPVAEGGRVRPYVRFASLPSCPHEADDRLWHLSESGAYPSGHAMLGWTWALLLSEAVPERSGPILQRGYEFGRSRLVCGFHWPSDIEAGRHAASALLSRLRADPRFGKDWQKALGDIQRARKTSPAPH